MWNFEVGYIEKERRILYSVCWSCTDQREKRKKRMVYRRGGEEVQNELFN